MDAWDHHVGGLRQPAGQRGRGRVQECPVAEALALFDESSAITLVFSVPRRQKKSLLRSVVGNAMVEGVIWGAHSR